MAWYKSLYNNRHYHVQCYTSLYNSTHPYTALLVYLPIQHTLQHCTHYRALYTTVHWVLWFAQNQGSITAPQLERMIRNFLAHPVYQILNFKTLFLYNFKLIRETGFKGTLPISRSEINFLTCAPTGDLTKSFGRRQVICGRQNSSKRST